VRWYHAGKFLCAETVCRFVEGGWRIVLLVF